MNTWDHILESQRLDLQSELDSKKTHAERNKLGQFSTPFELAREILRSTQTLLPRGFKIRFLDPAFGTGAFYSALLNVFPLDQIESATGIEIDAHYGAKAHELWASNPLQLHIEDFFKLELPDRDDLKPNLIICNPPYVRHHHIRTSEKQKLQRLVATTTRFKLNGLAGLYCYFLLYAHEWLQDAGFACWLIPSEFMDVKYGREVKKYLLNAVTLLRIHRFNASTVQFNDALVSSSLVWFRKTRPQLTDKVEFSFGSLAKPQWSKTVPISELKSMPKWSSIALQKQSRKPPALTLGDLFEVKRGIATGANDFFILSDEEIQRLKLPSQFLIPILPSPRYVKQDIIEADSQGNPILEKKLFLVSCSLPESQVKQRYPSLWEYYEEGVDRKVHRHYICSHRTPWYSQEFRPPAPILCSYMGRQTADRLNPFRFILNRSKAIAPNVYLMLYPKSQRSEAASWFDLIERIWQAFKKIPTESLVGEGRIYGGGLHKLEPKELSSANVEFLLTELPELKDIISSNGYNLFSSP